MDNPNGTNQNGETALLERRERQTVISPSGEWRESPSVNASGRYAVEESGGLDFAQILSVGRRRWKLMLGVMLVCLFASAFTVWRAKSVYQATATLEMNPTNKQQMNVGGIPGMEQFSGSSLSRNLDTQIEIIKSAPVRSGAVKNLPEPARANLGGGSLEVAQRGNTNLVDVQVRSLDAKAAADFANAICQQYIDASLQKNRNNSLGAVKFVQGQIDKVRVQLASAQNALSRFKKDKGVYSLSDQASQLTSSLNAKKTALEAAQTERASVQAQLNLSQSQLAGIPENKRVPTGIIKNPAVIAIQQQITDKEIELSTALQEFTETSQKAVGLKAELSSLRAQLKKQAQTIVSSLQPDPRRLPLAQSVAASQATLWGIDATIRALGQQIAVTQEKVNQLPDQEIQYAQLVGEVELRDGLYKQFQQSLSNLLITQSSQTPDARLDTPATPNFNPVAPDKRRILLTGLLMGLLGALALAMLVDALDNRIYNEDDAQRATHLPVLAQIPFIKKADQQSLYLTGERVSPLLESNRMLRANISFCATDKPVKAVVVTSSVPNEGKSSSALNLAVAAALSGESVILVDLDLRRPTQHVLTGLPNSAGFTNIIAGQVGMVAALQDTPIPNLRVLTSGPTPPNPYKMLNSQTARTTIQKLISMADFVVIDTPPMLGLADARLISGLVDGTLMVISAQETGRREASRAADLMASANQEVLGTVLTKVPNTANAYGSYHTYQRYGRYFDENQRTAEKMDEAVLAGKLDAAPSDKEV